jgi:hypothetical protein
MPDSQRIAIVAAPWFPYALVPSDQLGDRPQLPAIIELGTANTWSFDVVMNTLADRVRAWHYQAVQPANPRRQKATPDELREWIALTRALADRVSTGEPTQNLMRHAAMKVERMLASPDSFFTQWPRLGTTADYQQRASLHLWAMEQMIRAVNASHVFEIPPTQFWPAMFDGSDDNLAFADYKAAMSRITSIDKKIKPGARDALMIAVLRGADLPTSEPYPAPPPK